MRVLLLLLALTLASAARAQDAGEIDAGLKAVELDPKNVAAHEALFRAFGKRGNIRAVHHLGKLVELQPDRAKELEKELEAMTPSPAPPAAFDPQALEKARAAYDAGKYDDVRVLLAPMSQSPDFPESGKYLLGMSYCKLYDAVNAMMLLMAMRRPRDKLGFELEAEVQRINRESLREMGAPPPDAKGNIHDAAVGGDVETVKAILAARPDAWKDLDPVGRPPLMRAIPAGHLAVVKALVEGGADVNAVEGEGITAMSALETAEQGVKMRLISPEIVTYLKSKGANNHGSRCSKNRDRIEMSVFFFNQATFDTKEPRMVDRLDIELLVARKKLRPEESKCPGGGLYRLLPGSQTAGDLRVECSTHGVRKPRSR
jgi:hypothetical protein